MFTILAMPSVYLVQLSSLKHFLKMVDNCGQLPKLPALSGLTIKWEKSRGYEFISPETSLGLSAGGHPGRIPFDLYCLQHAHEAWFQVVGL
jgi:hypothetical protein